MPAAIQTDHRAGDCTHGHEFSSQGCEVVNTDTRKPGGFKNTNLARISVPPSVPPCSPSHSGHKRMKEHLSPADPSPKKGQKVRLPRTDPLALARAPCSKLHLTKTFHMASVQTTNKGQKTEHGVRQ